MICSCNVLRKFQRDQNYILLEIHLDAKSSLTSTFCNIFKVRASTNFWGSDLNSENLSRNFPVQLYKSIPLTGEKTKVLLHELARFHF